MRVAPCIQLREQPFDPWQEIARRQQQVHGSLTDIGATAVFVGTMRDSNEGDAVTGMTLEHYPEMTGEYLRRLSAEATERWTLRDALLIHRVGDIEVGQAIVLVAVWSAHRGEALAACDYLIEALKSGAPFWKKERLAGGAQRWVTHNTSRA